MGTRPETKIPGDYQYRANYQGPAFQRFLHYQRKLLIDWLLEVKPGDVVLDAGCGSGVFADYLGRKGATVWAVDTNEDAIAFATRTFGATNLHFQVQAIHEVDLPDASVNKIFLSEVLEHLPADYQEEVASAFERLLVPGGLLLVTAPNYRSLWPVLEKLVDALHLVPPLHEQHIVRTSVAYLRRCAFNRFATLEVAGCYGYLAPYFSVLSWRMATGLAKLEFRAPLPGGLGTFGLWRKPP